MYSSTGTPVRTWYYVPGTFIRGNFDRRLNYPEVLANFGIVCTRNELYIFFGNLMAKTLH